jgi:hypothetical protein
MTEQLNALIQQALTIQVSYRADGKPVESFSVGRGKINGKTVEARVVEQCRRTTSRAKQCPAIVWKVDGKRVSAADLQKAIA